VLAAVTSVVATLVVLILWHRDGTEALPEVTTDGLVFSALTVVTTVIQTAILVLAAWLAGWRVADYLGLVWPSAREAMIAVAAMVAFILGFDALTYLLGRDIVTPFQLDTYRSARESGGLLLLWITFVIVAPAGEEIMFRGFLYRGWAPSRRAVLPAIVVISAAWAIIHLQYDWFGIGQVFLVGLVLGWVRWRSGSTLLTFALHALANAWATVQTLAKVEWLS
jgi:membrane protease YdiL (CAAX protease family)